MGTWGTPHLCKLHGGGFLQQRTTCNVQGRLLEGAKTRPALQHRWEVAGLSIFFPLVFLHLLFKNFFSFSLFFSFFSLFFSSLFSFFFFSPHILFCFSFVLFRSFLVLLVFSVFRLFCFCFVFVVLFLVSGF